MRFHRLDLNLLVVLDVLIDEQNVSLAANRLNLTQPAISNSLAKLREHFEDELLIKLGRQMVPTPLAESLREPIKETLTNLQAIAVARPSFDPKNAEKEFIIVASDYVVAAFLPDIIQQLASLGPKISIRVLPVQENSELLARGEVDFSIIPHENITSDHPNAFLFAEEYTCIAWSGNKSIKSPLKLKDFLSARHVITAFESERMRTCDEAFLRGKGYVRKVVATIPSFNQLPSLIVGTKNIATVQKRLAQKFSKYLPLKIISPTIKFPKIRENIQWHRNRDRDPENIWMREFLIKIAGDL